MRGLAYCLRELATFAANAWLGAKLAGEEIIGNQVFNNSVGIAYDSNRKLVWALGQRSEVRVLRFDPKAADLQPAR